VIPYFLQQRKTGSLPITDPEMTRFNISLSEGVEMVLHALDSAWGGEIFVPKIPSYRITEVAQAIAPDCTTEIVGIRPGEKLHEEMITSSDSYTTYDLGKYYAILPQTPIFKLSDFVEQFNAKKVQPGFQYNSGTNEEWVSVDQMRDLLRQHLQVDI